MEIQPFEQAINAHTIPDARRGQTLYGTCFRICPHPPIFNNRLLAVIHLNIVGLGLTDSRCFACCSSLFEVYLVTASNLYFWKGPREKCRRRHLQKLNLKHQYRLHNWTVLARHFTIKSKQLRLPLLKSHAIFQTLWGQVSLDPSNRDTAQPHTLSFAQPQGNLPESH